MLYTVQQWDVESGLWRSVQDCEWIDLDCLLAVLADFKAKAPVSFTNADEWLRVMPAAMAPTESPITLPDGRVIEPPAHPLVVARWIGGQGPDHWEGN